MSYAELFESILEPEIEDADEETFWLYSQPHPSSDLGFVDPRAASVEVRVGGTDFTVHQSPGVLSSDRAGGTTGAVLWKISPVFADWLAAPTNFLFSRSLLGADSAVLELGCGVSPLNALALAPRVASHTLTDQAYVRRLIRRNIDDGVASLARKSSKHRPAGRISFETLDWETDATPPAPGGFDAVLAVDCVYNAALVPPLVQTCADACRRRGAKRVHSGAAAA
ncbi:hypothetical protein ISF_05382 [Cordyceps fumosorosea ARSEF 2679]|uniref:Nicotinamide N-methyltransferase n=1 Tax=Cordyceps fumosorosea (strain ARSEF 2679) TaxID=1081104 RepID=A0A167U739_CORFA|nr:hypothetical protein ISF_05382 [Cordyceps fumosorosea ARSEF 2679]OAA61303.1 hypothetical protein ISF_05382 [Cordyceps fumosorosea ARSEF 2679]